MPRNYLINKLIDNNWSMVDSGSGKVLYKGDFTLYIGKYSQRERDCFTSDDCCNNIPEAVELPNIRTYQLEYLGCVVDAGVLSSKIASERVEELVDNIIGVSNGTKVFKVASWICYDSEERAYAITSTKSEPCTGDIIIISNDLAKKKSTFSKCRTFEITVNGDYVNFKPVEISKGLNGSYNITQVKEDIKLPDIEYNNLLALISTNHMHLMSVDIVHNVKKEYKVELYDIVDKHSILDDVCDSGFDINQRYTINKALNDGYDVTDLLDNRIHYSVMNELLAYIEESIDISFIHKYPSLSTDVVRYIKPLLKKGFNIEFFIDDTICAIDSKLSYLMDPNMDLKVRLASDGYSSEQIDFIVRTYTYGNGIKHIISDIPVFQMLVKDNIYREVDTDLMEYFEAYGVYNGAELCVDWCKIDDNFKHSIENTIKSIPVDNIGNTSWSSLIDRVMLDIDSIVMDTLGTIRLKIFYFNVSNYYIEVKRSSVVFYDYMMTPMCSIMFLNGKVYLNDKCDICEVIFHKKN